VTEADAVKRLTARVYSPYGAQPSSGHPLLGFTGQPMDSISGCYHLGNGRRAYNPVLMRFQSPDTLSPFGRGGINSYAYCSGDPVNRIDPRGQWSWPSNIPSWVVSGVSMLSSAVTAIGAAARTARNVINQLINPSGASRPSFKTRIGNTSLFYTGVFGVTGTALSGVEQGWMGNVLTTPGRGFGLGNALGNINGGLFSNAEAIADVWRRGFWPGTPGVSRWRIIGETAFEVTGGRLAYEAASYLGSNARSLASRVAASYRSAAETWRSWGANRPPSAPPGMQMENLGSRGVNPESSLPVRVAQLRRTV
jgi:RHS repeat-associated protein